MAAPLFVAAALLATLTACSLLGPNANQFSANTKASADRNGFKYDSNKNQENLDATGDIDPTTGKMHFAVKTTATTPEATIAATLAAYAATMQTLSDAIKLLVPLAQSALTRGAGIPPAGTPPPPATSSGTTPPLTNPEPRAP